MTLESKLQAVKNEVVETARLLSSYPKNVWEVYGKQAVVGAYGAAVLPFNRFTKEHFKREAKKALVGTYSASTIITPVRIINEMVIPELIKAIAPETATALNVHSLSAGECLYTRSTNLPFFSLAYFILKGKDNWAQMLNITKDSPRWKTSLANGSFSLTLQLGTYFLPLVLSGMPVGEAFQKYVTNAPLQAALTTVYTIPLLDTIREVHGVAPNYVKEGKAPIWGRDVQSVLTSKPRLKFNPFSIELEKRAISPPEPKLTIIRKRKPRLEEQQLTPAFA